MNLSAVYDRGEAMIAGFINLVHHDSKTPKAVILSYHNICNNENPDSLQDSVMLDQFIIQMQFLYQTGINVISFQALCEKIRDQTRISSDIVVLTFDDGYRSTYDLVLPILKKYSFPATIFLATDYIGLNEPFPWLPRANSSKFRALLPLNWEQIRLMANYFEIGSHTCSHPFLPYQSPETIELELSQSQIKIREKIEYVTKTCALPYSFPVVHGDWSGFKDSLIRALELANYTGCCNLMRGYVNIESHPYFLPRFVIGKNDTLRSFVLKASGFYGWTRYPQWIYQEFFKTYRDFK